jgi:hypothetical protein
MIVVVPGLEICVYDGTGIEVFGVSVWGFDLPLDP